MRQKLGGKIYQGYLKKEERQMLLMMSDVLPSDSEFERVDETPGFDRYDC